MIACPSPDPVPPTLASPGRSHLTPVLLETWGASLDSLGAPEAAGKSLSRLSHARVVVTGQQPGVWGGPLYSAYKAATAVALARHLERDGNGPVVPVFWMGADDTDHDEVAWGTLPNEEGRLFRYRWPGPKDARSWLGNRVLPFPSEASAFLEAPPAFWGAPDPDSQIELGRGFASFLYRLLGDQGLLVLDARWPEVALAGRPLLEAYVEGHRAVTGAVLERGESLRAEGRPSPLDDQAERGLFLNEGPRRTEVEEGDWQRSIQEALAHRRQVTPSVLLRAPLQDYLLGTAAQVVGRGESAYLAQLSPVYNLLKVPEPARVPRAHVFACPRGWVPADALPAAVEDPEGYVARMVESPDLHDMRSAMDRHLDRLAEVWGGEQSGREALSSTRKRIDYQLKRLEQQLDRQARRALYRRRPHLRHLPEFLKPRRGPQDRGLSALSLVLWLGEAAGPTVLDWARAHVRELEEGRCRSWIVEVEHE